METQEQIIAMEGTQGSEILIEVGNAYLSENQWEDFLNDLKQYHPTQVKKYQKNAKKVLHTWTWSLQSGRLGKFPVRTNDTYEEVK